MKCNKVMQLVVGMALGIFSSLPQAALASVDLDAVRDSNGNFVRDSNNNCVRTKWETPDPCCDGVKSDAISEIMKMEERIAYFDFDKSILKESEKAKLRKFAEACRKNNIRHVKIVGYTDRIGTDSYNHGLSKRRAHSVKAYLDSIIKLDSSIVEVKALGKHHQVKGCEDVKERNELIDCLAPNRRVEVEVSYATKAVR